MTLAPGPYYSGTPIRLTISITDEDGNGVDPATVLIKLMNPDRASTTYTYGTDAEVNKAATGDYYADVTPDRGGRWFFRWETTGAGTTVTKEDNFIVQTSPFIDGCGVRDYQ